MNPIAGLVAMIFCIIMSAYFSATETAFSAINKTRLKVMADDGDKKAQRVLRLAENYDKLLSTILVGNNIVNIAMASIGTLLFVALYGDMGATISTVVVTVAVLIFGEITPKSIAKDNPESFAMFSAPFIGFLIWLFTPLNFLFYLWKKLVQKVIKSDPETKMSQEELLQLVEDVQQEGSIDESEGELLRNAIEFRDLIAEDILTHRVDLEAVSVDATKEEVAQTFTQSRFSRLLVYQDTIDNVVGVIHQKDFYINGGMTEKSLSEIMTPPVFIHQYEKIRDLLDFLQENKSHIAIVIDEYGGTLGIVTMEDILEELVGEIWDEHDEVVETFQKLEDDLYRVDCLVNLDDFQDFYDLQLVSDSVSVGGWVMEQLGRIPEIGDSFQVENLTVTVTELDAHRVSFISVRQEPLAQEEA